MVLPGIHGQSIFKWHEQQQQMIKTNHWLFVSQTEEVLSKDSAEDLNKGLNPGPMTEIKFWEAKVGLRAKGLSTFIWELVVSTWFDFPFSASTWSPCSSRWRRTRRGRWRPSWMWRTAPTTPPSSPCSATWSPPSTSPLTSPCTSGPLLDIMRLERE